MQSAELNKTTSLNISNEIIRVAGAPGKFNKYTNSYEPFYTRPKGQNIEQQAYLDSEWAQEANIVYNQPNNLRCLLVTTKFILAIFYKPVNFINNDGQTIQRLFNIQPYNENIRVQLGNNIDYQERNGWIQTQTDNRVQVSQPIRWLTNPRIYSNIEEIVFDYRIFQIDQQGKEHIKQIADATKQAVEQLGDNGLYRLKAICIANKIEIEPKKLLSQSQIIQTLQQCGVTLKTIYKSDNIDNAEKGLVVRPEYYRYDLEVLKPIADKLKAAKSTEKHIQSEESRELESILNEYTDKFGEKVASKMVQMAVREAINKVGSQVYTPQQIRQKMIDELQTDGSKRFKDYLN